jgi:hypothetical protein
MNDRRTPIASGLDTFAVVLFVAIGRRNHDQDPAVSGLIYTAAPFLIGLAVGWLAARAWRRPYDLLTGVVVWAFTVGVGMLLRRTVFDRGTALSFVIVAGCFTALCLVGWRAGALLLQARRRQRASA